MITTTNPKAMRRTAKTHFEEYGLRVPLLHFGQKRLHARSVEDLAAKSKESLVVIVKAYADRKATKIIKSLVSRTALAEWIERVETLALGSHPESKLLSTKKEDILEALGLNASILKATRSTAKKTAPSKRPGQEKTASTTEDKATAQSNLAFAAKTAKSEVAQKQKPVKPTTQSKKVTQTTNKRKYDSASATGLEQTPAKKTKTGVASSSTTFSPRMRVAIILEAQDIEKATSAPGRTPEPASEDQERSIGMIGALKHTISHAEASEIIKSEPAAKNDTENSNSSPHHPITIGDAIHTTFIPHGYDGDACPKSKPEPERFLKTGRHGRKGDFANDPDLLAGRGHQVDPLDLKRKREFEAKYHAFHSTWPYWPFIDKERKYLSSKHIEEKAELDEAERWMVRYRKKYPGEVVGHLWPCGCEVPRDGDESEEQ
ncbi:hypothetical protein SVAN01_00430 [Stagonosporopsis vannaccii]|nr:hypothetical protein SVAN01_00430 [Stagonosporopsis vannaccii]